MLTILLSLAFGQETPPIVNGATTSSYPAVGMFYGCSDPNWNDCWTCSGTLVHPKWVVTAAHCVEGLDLSAEIYFIIGPSWDDAVDWSLVTEYWAHEQYDTNTLLNDIAVLKLSDRIVSTAPMKVNTNTVDGSWIGEELQMVGYGVTSSYLDDSSLKRTADMYVEEVYQEFVMLQDYTEQQNICSGDSGGAALSDISGDWELIGVNSFTMGDCDSFEAGIVPVDRYVSWIEGKGVPINEEPDPVTEPSGEPSNEPSGETPDNGDWVSPFGPIGSYDSEDPSAGTTAGCSGVGFDGLWVLLLGCWGILPRRQSRS